jgi:hypothetical protein
MQANPNLAPLSREFVGAQVSVPQAFAPGDTLTADAAAWLNGQLATVIGNATGGFFRRHKEAYLKEGGKEKDYTAPCSVQAKFDELFADYSLSGNRGSGGVAQSADPVASLARTIATNIVKAKIIAKGLKVKAFMDAKVTDDDGSTISKFTQLVNAEMEKNGEAHTATAQAQIDGSRDDGDDSDFSLDTPTSEAQAA